MSKYNPDYSRKYWIKNREKINKRRREWRKRNPLYVLPQRKYDNKILFGGNRQVILERDNFECQECGMTNEECLGLFGRALNIHHIDGRGRNTDKPNNDPKNLITLCFRCHRKQH